MHVYNNLFLLGLVLLTLTSAQQEAPHYRTCFYVSGSYTPSPTNSSEHIHTSQIYVERLTPIHPHPTKPPILLIHGQAQTGTNFLNTPDLRPGWSSHFLAAGHLVYIVDQPYRGRSPAPPHANLTTYSAEYISRRFTAVERLGVWPQARLHTQWPGAGVMGDPVFDAFYEGNAAFEADTVVQQHRMRAGLVELLRRERMGSDVVVLTHSQGGLFGWGIADVVGVRGVVALEPTGPPFENAVFSREGGVRGWGMVDIPLRYDPPVGDPGKDLELVRVGVDTPEKVSCLLQKEGRVRKLVGLAKVPVLVVTAQASFHAVYDHCSVEYLRQAGVDTEWYRLEEMGQKGNGHMMFMEKNSWEIWRLVEGWIDRLK